MDPNSFSAQDDNKTLAQPIRHKRMSPSGQQRVFLFLYKRFMFEERKLARVFPFIYFFLVENRCDTQFLKATWAPQATSTSK